jgi:hypothetical protein
MISRNNKAIATTGGRNCNDRPVPNRRDVRILVDHMIGLYNNFKN